MSCLSESGFGLFRLADEVKQWKQKMSKWKVKVAERLQILEKRARGESIDLVRVFSFVQLGFTGRITRSFCLVKLGFPGVITRSLRVLFCEIRVYQHDLFGIVFVRIFLIFQPSILNLTACCRDQNRHLLLSQGLQLRGHGLYHCQSQKGRSREGHNPLLPMLNLLDLRPPDP